MSDFNPRMQIRVDSSGFFAAFRQCVSSERTKPEFFDNAAQLAVFRVDRRLFKSWDSLAEVRMLNLPDVSQRRRGALAEVY